jgi:hypothetical protein
MSARDKKKDIYKSLKSSARNRTDGFDARKSLTKMSKPRLKNQSTTESIANTRNDKAIETKESATWQSQKVGESPEKSSPDHSKPSESDVNVEELSFSQQVKYKKDKKKTKRDYDTLNSEFWLARNGHSVTYAGLFLFSFFVLFRPYELFTPLGFLSSTPFYIAAITIAFYLPTQLITEGNISHFSTEVKAVVALTLLGLITIPLAKSAGIAWETFNDIFIKAILMFVVMVNVIRTRTRLMAMMWLSLSVGLFLSYTAVTMYINGELNAEGYRVAVKVGGMFGNPNDLALHVVTMMPLAIALGLASKKKWHKILYFVMTLFFIGAVAVTYSRGGFLGLIAVSCVLSWKLGRNNRFKVMAVSIVAAIVFLLVAPGNYGLRMLSIFIPGLDPVGSSSQRQDLLVRSILVTLRNPWGIGIGNFQIVGVRNLSTHNAFTQVSSELGILGFAAYLTFMISPFRKLAAIERILFSKSELNWYYYVSIGFQASIVGYMVSSFFAPVAYNWFIYYLIAYAVCFRRIYKLASDEAEIGFNKTSNVND